MSGTFPITDFDSVTIGSNTPSYTSTSISGKRQVKQIASQYWTIEAKCVPLQKSQIRAATAFLSKQFNNFYDFDVYFPTISYSAGQGVLVAAAYPGTSDVMTITGNVNAGTSSISCDTSYTQAQLDTIVNSYTKFMSAGDFIRFSNHSKVYQLTDDAGATLSPVGGITLNVFPPLITAVTTADTVMWKEAPFRVYVSNSSVDVEYSKEGSAILDLKLQESL